MDAVNGTFDHIFAGEGTHIITLSYEVDDCISTATHEITVIPLPTANFTVTTPHCVDETSLITYTGDAAATASFNWNFDGGNIISGTGEGPYEIQWDLPGMYTVQLEIIENNCSSIVHMEEVEIEPTLIPPVINCISTDNSVSFVWDEVDGADSYVVSPVNGFPGFFTSNTSYLVTGLAAGTEVIVELSVISSNSCPDLIIEHSCVAETCPIVDLTIDPLAPICLLDNVTVDLEVTIAGGTGTGTGTWSGLGIIDAVTGEFDPAVAGPGLHQITFEYEESANCSYTTSININVPAAPVAAFTAPALICIEEGASIQFSGTASNMATFTWDFDGGTIESGSGEGPYTITWTDSGPKTITLIVDEDGCTTEVFSEIIQVDPALETPQVICSSTFSEVSYSWAPVPGATSYQVNVLAGEQGAFLSDTEYGGGKFAPRHNKYDRSDCRQF